VVNGPSDPIKPDTAGNSMFETGWSLHPQLASDALAVGEAPPSHILAVNDADYPWMTLVPRSPARWRLPISAKKPSD